MAAMEAIGARNRSMETRAVVCEGVRARSSLWMSACGDGAARELHLCHCIAVNISTGSGPMLLVHDWRSYKCTGP